MTAAVALTDLAAQINAAHAAAEKAASTAVGHACRAGELLIQAKKACAHGDWLKWLAENVTVMPRMAQNYIALARALPKLQPEEAQRVAHLPVRDAVRVITVGATRLARLPAETREQICQTVESGEHSFAAVAKLREDERREILRRPVANPIRTVTECWDHWSTPKALIESSAKDIEQRISRESYSLKHLINVAEPTLLPYLPERLEGEFVAKEFFDQMRVRRAEMRKELRKRIKELAAWAQGQDILIAALLWKAAEGATEEPILIARSTRWSDGSEAMQLDLRNAGFLAKKTSHTHESCDCGNRPPLWCPKPDGSSPRARRCVECAATLTHRNYCGDGDVCSACARRRQEAAA